MNTDHALTFRRAIAADAAMVRDLVRAAYAKWIPVTGREPRPMQADYDKAVIEHEITLLFRGSDPIGLIELIVRPDHLWIENVAIQPGSQGNGYGRTLLALAERQATAAGLGETRLLTNGAWTTNIALYERLGYAITKTEPFMDSTAIYLAKRLRGG